MEPEVLLTYISISIYLGSVYRYRYVCINIDIYIHVYICV